MSRLHPTLLCLVLAACAPKVGENAESATVEPASAASVDPAEAIAAPVTRISGAKVFPVDPSRSRVGAVGAKVTATHPIDFHDYSGTLQVKKGELVGVDVTVEVASLSTEFARLTDHLNNEDFLYTDVFPRARFSSTVIEPSAGPDTATHAVTGILTLHGVSQQMRFPATVSSTGDAVEASAEFVIDRRDFGITYPGRADDMIQTDVLMTIQLVADAA